MAIVVHDRAVELETEADAYEFLEQLRWGDDGPTECPHCASVKGAWFLKPKDPEGRKSKGGSSARSHRRVWKCRENSCRRQFSVLTNTVMHATKLPVRAWVGTVFDLCSNPDGVSARDIADQWGVTPKSAFAMLTRLQDALATPETGGAQPASNTALWIELNTDMAAISAAEQAKIEAEKRAAETAHQAAREAQATAQRIEEDIQRALLGDDHAAAASPVSGATAAGTTAVTRADRVAQGVAADVAEAPIDAVVSPVSAVAAADVVGVSRSDGVVVEGDSAGVARLVGAIADPILEPQSGTDSTPDRAVPDVEIEAQSPATQTQDDAVTTPAKRPETQSTPEQMDLWAVVSDDTSGDERGADPANSAVVSDAASDTIFGVAKASTASASDVQSLPKIHDVAAGRASHPTARAAGNAPKIRNGDQRRSARPATVSGENAPVERPAEGVDPAPGSRSETDGRRAKRRSNRDANEGRDEAKRAGDDSGRSSGRSSDSRKKRRDRDGRKSSSQPVDNSQKRSADRRRAPGELGGASVSRAQERRNRKRRNSDVATGAESLGIGWLDGSGADAANSGRERPRPDAAKPPARGLELGPEWVLSAGREEVPSGPASDDPVSRRAVEPRGDSDET